jgi:hypothetical protein
MKAFVLALLVAITASFAAGQVSIMRDLVPRKAMESKETGTEIVIMPKVEVKTWQDTKSRERIMTELERRFSTPRKSSDVVFIQSTEPATASRLEESSFFDFGMMGKDLKSLKGGFELWGMDFYIKSGLAWHPSDNKYVTIKLGKKTSWSYSFKNGHDLLRYNFQKPIERFNERILERPVYSLLERLGLK